MKSMGLQATGVIIRNRETGAEFGMHIECAETFMQTLVDLGYSPLDPEMPAVVIGPLFADPSEWTCASASCSAGGN